MAPSPDPRDAAVAETRLRRREPKDAKRAGLDALTGMHLDDSFRWRATLTLTAASNRASNGTSFQVCGTWQG